MSNNNPQLNYKSLVKLYFLSAINWLGTQWLEGVKQELYIQSVLILIASYYTAILSKDSALDLFRTLGICITQTLGREVYGRLGW